MFSRHLIRAQRLALVATLLAAAIALALVRSEGAARPDAPGSLGASSAAAAPPKPAWAHAPASGRVLELTVDRPGEPDRFSETFTEGSKVAQIGQAIGDMALSAHGVKACWPLGPNEHEPEATFTFRASAEGPVLARAVMPAWTRTESGACGDQVILQVSGHGTLALGQGAIVEQAEAIFAVQIRTYRYRL